MVDTIEIAIKADGRQALANLEKLRQALADVDGKASTARARYELESLNRVWNLTHRELSSGMRLLGGAGGIAGLFAGGLVAGLVAGGRALADFGRAGIELHYLAKQLNVSAESLTRWKLAGQAAGLSSDAAAQDVANAMKKIQDLGRRRDYSDLYTELKASTANRTGKALADQLYAEVQSGGPEKGFRFMLSKLSQYSKEGNQWGITTIEKVLGLRGKGWERSVDLIDKVGKVTVVSAEDALKFQLNLTLLGGEIDAFTTAIGNELLPVFADMTKQLTAWLQSDPGKEFQKSIVDGVKELQKLPWEDIGKGAKSALGGLGTLFREAKKTFATDIEDIKKIMEAYDNLVDWNRKKQRDERLGGVQGPAAQREEQERQRRWHPRTAPPVPAKPPQGVLDPLLKKMFPSLYGPGRGGTTGATGSWDSSKPQRFSGGDDTDFSSVARRAETTESLNDQMRDVTDEVRRLNDLLRGGGDVASTSGGGAGGMGLSGGGGGGGGGGGYSGSGGGGYSGSGGGGGGTTIPDGITQAGASSPYRPVGSTGAAPSSTASLGYDSGGFTKVQDLTTASGVTPGSGGGTDATKPYPATASESERGGALYQKLLAEFKANPPQGIPPDGARFGITKGTPEEWARFGVAVANEESSFNPKTKNLADRGGSFGVFQYSHSQAYGDAYNVDNSVKAFVRDSNQVATNPGGFGSYGQRGSSIMANRFNVVGVRPGRTIRSLPLANTIQRQQQGGNTPEQTPATAAISNLKLAQTSEIDLSGMLDPSRTKVATVGTGDGTSLVSQVQGKVAGTRRGGIDPRLEATFQYAAEQAGLRVRVTSGGQRMEGAPGATGSHRHDQGKAADFDLVDPKTGAVVGRDDPRRLAFIENAAKAGAGGAGYGYMSDPLKLHMGITGSKSVVGEGLGAYAGNAAEIAATNRGIAAFKQGFDVNKALIASRAARVPITTLAVKRNDDEDATRKVVDSSLVNSMSPQVMKGKATIGIDVGGAGKQASGDSDKGLFDTPRSKSAPQMPNTVTNEKGDKSSGSSEGDEGKDD